jgi:hypothetical protein
MAEIWLTAAAQEAYSELLDAAPTQAGAVSDAINDIRAHPGQPINLPGAPPAEPFLSKEPRDLDAPAVIYRRTTPGEQGDWLVISLMDRAEYRAAREAEQALANYPLAVQTLIEGVARKTITSGRPWQQRRKSSTIEADPDEVPSSSAEIRLEVIPLEDDPPSGARVARRRRFPWPGSRDPERT